MLLSTIFTSLVVPLQVHPTSSAWNISPTPIVQAVIDSARIIGLPRMKDMDKAMFKSVHINEFQVGMVVYSIHPRKAFIHNYVNTN
ncbi:hypothetical protein [Polynucleobacter sp. HIN5]|uniref:hypothetical protein n=1 Tax=Polynucleobacter sp. HIN5 TaxID=3047864 RepID=UPI002573A3C7|nr:hypothetical protein [Polynucleobacter sp. HIN5]BEI33208.1 hypothetical protein PHIN5_05760 [Polynucleobacter sp. HIN5]